MVDIVRNEGADDRMGTPAIFLDRDGVLNVNRDSYVRCWDELEYLPGTFGALSSLKQFNVPIIVVTNQAGVNRGIMSREIVEDIHRRMLQDVTAADGRVDDILFCPHRTDERCKCRKPEPGLLHEAAKRYDIDLSRSVMVGDALTDIMAGRQAGCQTILVLTGRGRVAMEGATSVHQNRHGVAVRPNAIVSDLSAAVFPISNLLFTPNNITVAAPQAAYDLAAL